MKYIIYNSINKRRQRNLISAQYGREEHRHEIAQLLPICVSPKCGGIFIIPVMAIVLSAYFACHESIESAMMNALFGSGGPRMLSCAVAVRAPWHLQSSTNLSLA